MIRCIIISLLASMAISAQAQSVVPGKILVKFNSTAFSQKVGKSKNLRFMDTNFILKPLAPAGNIKANSNARPMAFKRTIPIELYHELTFDPALSVEEVRSALLKKGIAEKAEPVYRENTLYTPNDLNSAQWYLKKINAEAAWDITKGSSDVVIAIIDSGGDLDHPDLESQLFHNEADPINGIDDDGNGYIDDYTGWDFSGDDTLNIFDPAWEGDNDPAIFANGPGFNHGTGVASCAAAATDNATGVAGIAFNSKLLFTKHFADNQKASSTSYNSNLYLGMLYAAHMGADIINCSWGGGSPSGIYQDLINYVTLDLGCVVVAAAGNSGNSSFLYPASYDNVLSVAASNSQDVKAGFTNFNSAVDIIAPGVDILKAAYNNTYSSDQGTSFSAPIVSGAAALVKALHPNWSALEIAEQIRVSSDASVYLKNPGMTGKLGYGRLDVQAALTKSLPSVRVTATELLNDANDLPLPGEEANLFVDLYNFLAPTTNSFKVIISSSSTSITILSNTIQPGVINRGAAFNNSTTPFRIKLASSIKENEEVEITFRFTDTGFSDQQIFSFIPKPSFRSINENLILSSISSTGRIGWDDPSNQKNGNGFVFDEKSILYEMGIMLGDGAGLFFNNVRGTSSSFDQDFISTKQITKSSPGLRSDAEISGEFSNNLLANNQKVKVKYRSMVWKEEDKSKFFILEYVLKNPTNTAITNLRFGLFADWDVTNSGGSDYANILNYGKTSYVTGKTDSNSPVGAIQLLTTPSAGNIYAIDNDQNLSGNPFGLYDGFTDTEKITSLSSSSKTTAGNSSSGNDVSHVVSNGPITIAAGDSVIVAFAVHGASGLDDLNASVRAADTVYNFTFKQVQPTVDTVEVCYESDATLIATGASKFKWYTAAIGGNSIATTSSLQLTNLKRDTILYVSNADKSYESLRTPAVIKVRAQPTITLSKKAAFCANESLTLTAAAGTSYLWSTGATTRSIEVSTAGTFSVTVTVNESPLNCLTTSDPVTTSLLSLPVADFTGPEELIRDKAMDFIDASTDALSWNWNFGDGTILTTKNPSHIFEDVGDVTITLTVTNANGCKDTKSLNFSVVTALERGAGKGITLFPNPTTGKVRFDGIPENRVQVTLVSASGVVVSRNLALKSGELDLSGFPTGVYFVKVEGFGNPQIRKILLVSE